jgi:hypothetical protein
MRNRTKVIAVVAVTAALAAGGTATALGSTAGAKPSAHASTVLASTVPATTTSATAGLRCAPDGDLASLLRVSPARLDQALRAVKTSLGAAGGTPTESQFDAALARYLGISQARVRRAIAAEQACGAKPGGGKSACPQPPGSRSPQPKAPVSKSPDPTPSTPEGSASKSPNPEVSKSPGSNSGGQQGHAAIVAAVARQLHVSTARVSVALQPFFAAGHADSSSPAFAAAARALGVSARQLSDALVSAKQSMAGCG